MTTKSALSDAIVVGCLLLRIHRLELRVTCRQVLFGEALTRFQVLILGSGPIVIGQAAEFDLSPCCRFPLSLRGGWGFYQGPL
jgi:hypothetical protein